jgi:hypothetical protein
VLDVNETRGRRRRGKRWWRKRRRRRRKFGFSRWERRMIILLKLIKEPQ